jgi:hypothetical protein
VLPPAAYLSPMEASADTEHGEGDAWAAGNTKASVSDTAASPALMGRRGSSDTSTVLLEEWPLFAARVRCTGGVGGRAGDRRVGVCRRS